MAYKIAFAAAAKRQFEKLPEASRKRVAETIELLGSNPRPAGAVKLAGEDGLYRVRSGDYRVIYRIEDTHLLVLVAKIGHRRDVYR